MARAKKKKAPIVRLEMRWGGLFSLVLVAFCLMLWMFLFGIWTGQTVLQRAGKGRLPLSVGSLKTAGSSLAHDLGRAAAHDLGRAAAHDFGRTAVKSANIKPAVTKRKSRAVPPDAGDGSFYAVQVGAFQDVARAEKAVSQWAAKEYKAFYLQPPRGSRFHRVFVGHLADLPAARKTAAKLEDKLKSKVFITLITSNQKRYK